MCLVLHSCVLGGPQLCASLKEYWVVRSVTGLPEMCTGMSLAAYWVLCMCAGYLIMCDG